MALVKLVDSASFFSKDEQLITILDFDKSKGLLKQASTDSRIQEFSSNIKPELNRIYVHILAMGAGEYYGANKNSDNFNEQNLIDCHKTFVTSPAHIFRNHVNKDPKIAIGQVIFSVYNERMHRVEVIAWIDRKKGADVVERIERGEFPATSMACKTPFDVCSICGNKAHTRAEYCEHLSTQLGKIYPDGRKVSALNVAPLKFFDMSIVIRPADVTSSVLQKLASETAEADSEQIIGSAEAAEMEGIDYDDISKTASFKKLSEFIKEVDGDIVDYSQNLEPLLAKVKDPHLDLIPALQMFKLKEIFETMAHLGISPSITFLAELIARKTMGEKAEGIGSLVASFVSEMGPGNINLPNDEQICGDSSHLIAQILTSSIPGSSMFPDYVEKRAMMTNSNIGYIGNGPHIEPTNYEKYRATNLANESEGLTKILHTIMAIGGAAIAAKWYITRAIEAKMKEAQTAKDNSAVKIILVKSASDYKLTYELAKAAMIKVVKNQK
jgi:hypothetical protein